MEETRLSSLLKNIGISPKLKGYYYIRDMLQLMQEEPGRKVCALYEDVAGMHGVTWCNVEHSIRYAIERAFTKASAEELDAVFGSYRNVKTGMPANKEFLMTILDDIQTEERKRHETTDCEMA